MLRCHHRASQHTDAREESLAFRRVLEEALRLLREQAAARILYRRPLDGELERAAELLLLDLRAGMGDVVGLLR
jgi:hypothetical protein